MNNVITNSPLQCAIGLAALQQVIDPEIGLNIVDLGLIYQLDFEEANNKIYLEMTLTTQFCPMGDSIRDGVLHAMQQSFPQAELEVTVTFSPRWSADRISEAGQEFLNQ